MQKQSSRDASFGEQPNGASQHGACRLLGTDPALVTKPSASHVHLIHLKEMGLFKGAQRGSVTLTVPACSPSNDHDKSQLVCCVMAWLVRHLTEAVPWPEPRRKNPCAMAMDCDSLAAHWTRSSSSLTENA